MVRGAPLRVGLVLSSTISIKVSTTDTRRIVDGMTRVSGQMYWPYYKVDCDGPVRANAWRASGISEGISFAICEIFF